MLYPQLLTNHKQEAIMADVEFFKQQAKNLSEDFNNRVFKENEGFYYYNPRFFGDIDDIVLAFDIDETKPLPSEKAQYIIARLAGFDNWAELTDASETILEIGKLLFSNRETYQKRQGLFFNNEDTIIVQNWKLFEVLYFKDSDDKEKLETFKKLFLEIRSSEWTKLPIITVDFTDDIKAQDMLITIMKAKKLTEAKAILSSINKENGLSILSTGWAEQAVSLWGHNDHYKTFNKLDKQKIKVRLSLEKACMLQMIEEKEKVSLTTAILYFMIFDLESLGYHI